MDKVPIKTQIDLGEGKWSIAAVRADGVPAILFQQLRSQMKIGEDLHDEDITDKCNVLIRIRNKAGFFQLQKMMQYIGIEFEYREDEAVHRAIEEANRKQEDKSNGN